MNHPSEVAMSEHLADDLLSTTAGGWRSFYDLLSRRLVLALPAGAMLSASEQTVSAPDVQFLEDLSRRSFRYFWELTDPDTGMTRGRCRADGTPYEANRRDIGSIAVTGFGLAGLCIAAERGWVRPDDAQERARNTL